MGITVGLLAGEALAIGEDLTGGVSGMLWIVLGAVGLLLIVACAKKRFPAASVYSARAAEFPFQVNAPVFRTLNP